MWKQRKRVIAVAILSLLMTLVLVLPPLLGVHTVPLPRGPKPPYRLADYEAALKIAVRPDGVDYQALYENRDPLLRFVHALASFGPNTHPEAFKTRPERIAYYLNAYNALVLYGVLVHRPVGSVHDVHGVIEPVPGFGFFWAQRFELDGSRTNLYDLEHDVIRGFRDARVHAALNCASASCPALREAPYLAQSLERQLEEATRSWVASDEHVRISDEAVLLSAIFDWFEEDFARHAKEMGVGSSMLDWVAHYLPEDKGEALAAARKSGQPVRYLAYDWSLNRASTSSTAGS